MSAESCPLELSGLRLGSSLSDFDVASSLRFLKWPPGLLLARDFPLSPYQLQREKSSDLSENC